MSFEATVALEQILAHANSYSVLFSVLVTVLFWTFCPLYTPQYAVILLLSSLIIMKLLASGVSKFFNFRKFKLEARRQREQTDQIFKDFEGKISKYSKIDQVKIYFASKYLSVSISLDDAMLAHTTSLVNEGILKRNEAYTGNNQLVFIYSMEPELFAVYVGEQRGLVPPEFESMVVTENQRSNNKMENLQFDIVTGIDSLKLLTKRQTNKLSPEMKKFVNWVSES